MARATTAKKSKSKTKAKISRKTAKMPKRKSAAKKTKSAKKVAKKKPVAKKAKTVKKISTATKAKVVATPAVELKRVGVGEMAPQFTLNDQNQNAISLSSFLGQKVVLYFYPKDDTPGCTKEACSFRDNLPTFEGADAVILGVSFDDANSHQKFISKYNLNFSLLSDSDKQVAMDYGCYVQKNMYGNISWGIERSTFVIDREGKIAAAFRRVQVDGHTEQVLEALKAIA